MRLLLKNIGILIVVLLIFLFTDCNRKESSSHPNIIFILLNDNNENQNEYADLPVLNGLICQSLVFEYSYFYQSHDLYHLAINSGLQPFRLIEYNHGELIKKYSFKNIEEYMINADYKVHKVSNCSEESNRDRLKITELGQFIKKVKDPFFIKIEYDFPVDDSLYVLYQNELNEILQNTLSLIDDRGERSNTAIVFTRKEHVRECDKNFTFINFPGRINARRSNINISELDFLPTFLELAGVTTKSLELDGQSLCELFPYDTKKFSDRELYWHFVGGTYETNYSAIQLRRYKLVQHLNDGQLEMYNVRKDTTEFVNIIHQRRKISINLLSKLVNWRKENKAIIPQYSNMKY